MPISRTCPCPAETTGSDWSIGSHTKTIQQIKATQNEQYIPTKRAIWTNTWVPVCLAALLLVACEENDNDPLPAPTDPYASGTFVVNEGPFTSGSGSLSHVDEDGQVVNEAFFLANGFPLGSVLQSAELVGDKLYIVANLSGRIEVVQKGTLNALRSTQLLGSPRYVQGLSDGRVAATDWATDKVYVLNASDLSLSQSFDVGVGPERMAVLGDRLYVLNSGGFGRGFYGAHHPHSFGQRNGANGPWRSAQQSASHTGPYLGAVLGLCRLEQSGQRHSRKAHRNGCRRADPRGISDRPFHRASGRTHP